jgi:hypothetical protein
MDNRNTKMLKKNITNQKQEKEKKASYQKKRPKKRIRELQQLRVDQIAKILEERKGNKRAFEAQRLLRKICRKPFQIRDNQGHLFNNPHHVISLLTA